MCSATLLRLAPLTFVCLTTFSVGRLFHFHFRSLATQNEDAKLSSAPSGLAQVHLKNDTLLQFGDDLYYSMSSKNTTRATCTRFDTLVAQWTPGVGPHRFHECMNALQESHDEWNNALLQNSSSNNMTCHCPNLLHATWKGPLPATARLGILSFLYAQPTNCVTLKLWVTDSDTEKSLQETLPNHLSLEILHLDFNDIANQIVALHPTLTDIVQKSRDNLVLLNNSTSTPPVGFSDVVRLFVLAAYGGIYLDCDMLLLKPLTPLLSRDFYYRWHVRHFGNTAAMHLQKGSKNAEFLVRLALEQSQYAASQRALAHVLHPQRLHYNLQKIPQSTVEMLPSAYFDPLWVIMDNSASRELYGLQQWDDFFTEPNDVSSVEAFFKGAFAFHWHNQWKADIVQGSSADMFLQHYESIITSQ